MLVLAGCGATASPAQREARCVDANWDESSYVSMPVDDSAWHQAVGRICREAAREGKLGSNGGLSKGELKDILYRRPRVAYPLCTDSLVNARNYRMTPAEQRHLPMQSLRRLARHYCDVVYGSGLATDSDGLTAGDRDALYRRHPELLTPFCVAGAQAAYDKEPLHSLTRTDFHKVMVLVCTESARHGYVTLGGNVDDAAITALSRRVTLRLIRQGRIHLVR